MTNVATTEQMLNTPQQQRAASQNNNRYAAVPAELKNARQWARWDPTDEIKKPRNLDGTPMYWQSKPETRLSFEEVARYPHIETFITLDSGIIGMDLDGCRNKETGEIYPLVKSWLGYTYAEISPSGTGIKMWVRGTLPNNKAIINNMVPWGTPGKHTGIELYADGRPFAVTGNIVDGCPSEINEVPEVLNEIITRFTPIKKTSLPKKGYWSLQEWKTWVSQNLEVIEEYEDCFDVVCPWKDQHTTPGNSMRIWYGPPHAVNCFHSHCKHRTWEDLHPKQDQWTNYNPGQDHSSNGNSSKPPESNSDGVIKAKKVSLKAIERFMEEMQYGDGKLFHACFDGQVVYDHLEKEWYLWNGQHWKRDSNGFVKVLISGHLGDVYIKASGELNIERAEKKQALDNLSGNGNGEIDLTKEPSEEEETLKSKIKRIDGQIKHFQARSKDLRKSGYKNAVLDYAQTACSAPLNDDDTSVWDSKKGLLGVKNGALDLRTGAFQDGRPEDYIRTVCPTNWKGLDAACPLFIQFLQDLFELREDKDELIQFLQRLLGYALTGTCQEALFVILCGALGRNGKTTLFKILTAAIGKALVGDIQKELLLDSGKNAPANGAKPDVLALQGKRFAIAAETKKGDKLNISAIKNYTGGDELSGRPVFGKHHVRFEPTHTLFLHTNYKPHADSGDEAFWARACLIDFGMRFVEEPDPSKPNERKYDPSLVNRIIENELPGVLAWIVRGALEYRKIGLKKPESVKLASQNYRIEEDTLLTFIKECCIVKEGCKVGASALYAAYKEWSGGTYQLNSKEFPKQMKAMFTYVHTKYGSFYHGIELPGDGSPSPGDGTFGDSSPSQLPFLDDETSLAASHAANDSVIRTALGHGDGSDGTFLKVPSGNTKIFKSDDFREKSITSVTSVDNNNDETACEAGLDTGDGHPKVPSPVESSVTYDSRLPNRACYKCGKQDWRWDDLLETPVCRGCTNE